MSKKGKKIKTLKGDGWQESSPFGPEAPKHYNRYTGYITNKEYGPDGDIVEEIDVDARNEEAARKGIKKIMKKTLVKGCKVRSVVEQHGWYM